MLSHLRFHRRAPSNPASPSQEQASISPVSSLPSPFPIDVRPPDASPPSSNSSALPPTLPPITRVTSADSEPFPESDRRDVEMASHSDSRPQQQQPMQRSPHPGDSGFIGGVALRNYQRDVEAQAAASSDKLKTPGRGSQHSMRPTLSPINTSLTSRPPPQDLRNTKATQSFSTPTEIQYSSSTTTGRRPAGSRLGAELPSLAPATSNPEPHKAKKALPFFRNSMSTLLMRRKNNQNVPDLVPLPLGGSAEEPAYDPRIRGTRVHDFSAPRRKKNTTETVNPYAAPPISHPDLVLEPEKLLNSPNQHDNSAPVPTPQQRYKSNASDSIGSGSRSTVSQPFTHTPSATSASTRHSGADTTSLEGQAGPPVPPKDNVPVPVQARLSNASRPVNDEGASLPQSTPSTRTNRTRELSISGKSSKEMMSAVPRHMKSTSSRFSFDMIGAAKQEKLLEDRHRQRELEKKATEPPQVHRDSRFDDFDEDGFDYDAMMDDGGYEEEIPMVGDDDYEEEIAMVGDDVNERLEDDDLNDPDNDQENFSGFVFQRSNPASSLASPRSAGLLPTPRDAEGQIIGYALSKDTPGLNSTFTPGLLTPEVRHDPDVQAAGLGIQGLDLSGPTNAENETAFQPSQQLPPSNGPRPQNQDDLYFDDGMIGFENEFAEDLAAPPEWDPAPFDESIFDNNDTDQFGRPIAGAFAQALSQRQQRAVTQEKVKRESDITSQLSAHSDPPQSTAHTSLSADAQPQPSSESTESPQKTSEDESSAIAQASAPGDDTMAAYQAALAAAAYKAEASGKFQREPAQGQQDEIASPEPGNSPSTPYRGGARADDGLNDYDDYDDYGYSYDDMADFELDDDAIIAEANASALANDSDGWYGQEFGFYSAPAGHHSRDSNPNPEFEYANGGFFGPKGGINRTISGRMLSREPNLTPITERSEYSNRNSIMSLGMPGFSGTPIQSPGLAQLAMMSDTGDEMTLSSLLRLRSRAWGGSQASLSSREGSPRSERGDIPSSPWGPAFFSPTAIHARNQSVYSTMSYDTEGGSISGSPTLTIGISGSTPPLPIPQPGSPEKTAEPTEVLDNNSSSNSNTKQATSTVATQPSPLTNISPVTETTEPPLSPSAISPIESIHSPDGSVSQRPGLGHRHKGSADSISYMKEEDSGETRWIMERRRTSELGQVEILGRQIVEGGRI